MRVLRLTTAMGIMASALLCVACGGANQAGAPTAAAGSGIHTVFASVRRRCGRAAAEALPPYPWPVAPVHRQHPVRGYFGDPRTVVTGVGEGAFSFHNGVDISARPGSNVLPVVSGLVIKVKRDRVVVSSPNRIFQYIHLHPAVRVGESVVASRTVLGKVDLVPHHVHLTEIRGMCVVNPLMPGHLTPYRDTTRPVVSALLFENLAGQKLSPLALTGKVRVIADAFDRPALPSRFPWKSLPVSPAEITWELRTMAGRVLRRQLAVDFRVSLPPRQQFCDVYAPGTLQNFAVVLGEFRWGQPGRYLYELTPRPLDVSGLHAGRYRFVVTASDTAGNSGTRSAIIAVRPRELTASLKPRADGRCTPG